MVQQKGPQKTKGKLGEKEQQARPIGAYFLSHTHQIIRQTLSCSAHSNLKLLASQGDYAIDNGIFKAVICHELGHCYNYHTRGRTESMIREKQRGSVDLSVAVVEDTHSNFKNGRGGVGISGFSYVFCFCWKQTCQSVWYPVSVPNQFRQCSSKTLNERSWLLVSQTSVPKAPATCTVFPMKCETPGIPSLWNSAQSNTTSSKDIFSPSQETYKKAIGEGLYDPWMPMDGVLCCDFKSVVLLYHLKFVAWVVHKFSKIVSCALFLCCRGVLFYQLM